MVRLAQPQNSLWTCSVSSRRDYEVFVHCYKTWEESNIFHNVPNTASYLLQGSWWWLIVCTQFCTDTQSIVGNFPSWPMHVSKYEKKNTQWLTSSYLEYFHSEHVQKLWCFLNLFIITQYSMPPNLSYGKHHTPYKTQKGKSFSSSPDEVFHLEALVINLGWETINAPRSFHVSARNPNFANP